MSAPDEPMAVTAPTLSSNPVIVAAHVPDVSPTKPALNGKQSSDSDSDDDMPLVRRKSAGGPTTNGTAGAAGGSKRPVASDSDSSSDRPLTKKARQSTGSAATKKRRVVESDSDEDSDEVPLKMASTSKQANGASSSKPTSTDAKPAPKAKLPPSPSSGSDSDDKPLAAKPKSKATPQAAKPRPSAASTASAKTNGASKPKAKPKKPASSDEESSEMSFESASESDSDSDAKPLAKKAKAAPKPRKSSGSTASAKKPRASKAKESSDDDVPLAKAKPKPRASGTKVKKEESSDDDAPLAKKSKAKPTPNGKGKEKAKDVKPVVKKEKKPKEEDDEDDDKYKWWEDGDNDGSVKWTHLEHMGVLFPPPYVPLPKNVKMRYDGQELTLPPESEEVAGFFGAMLETDHAQDAKFRENFFRDFKQICKEYPPKEGVKVSSLEKCDFKPMFEHFEREKEKKKAMTKEEKKTIKDAKDKLEEPYLHAMVDGRKEKVGNFRAEPPGLFRGRGEHPKKGTLKKRLQPSDIILNIAEDAPVPVPNAPGEWNKVTHDNTVTWLAHWKENVNGNSKYVFLSAGSAWKGMSDRSKFEKARELIKHVDKIRKDYTADLKSKVMADRQRATALYFIDKLALRAGNEKGEDEAETFGCCSLRYEHITLEPPNKVIFDFLGKDSMRFHQEVEVEHQVFKNIKIFKDGKDRGDDIFDRLTTGGLNNYLQTQMKGLSAKVFRTYNASWTFQIQLKNTPADGTIQEKISAYNTANRDVAILCNHQKTVSKGFEASFAKMGDRVRALKYQRMKLRYQLFSLEPKAKKRHPDFAEDESDVDDEFIQRHEEELKEKAIDQATKKWEKDNVKLAEEKEAKKPKSVLEDRIKEIKEEFKELKKERKSRKVEPKRGATEEKLVEQIKKMDDRIAAAKVQMGDRDKAKDVALGTSKINYIDPRLTVAWAAKYDVPLDKLFSKTLREKFPWAEAEADATWVF